MPRVSEVFGRQFLRGADLPTPIVAIIESWGSELAYGEETHFITLREQAVKVRLTPTNANDLALLFGEDFDGWVAREIELYSVQIEITDRKTGLPKMVDMIRVRAPSPKRPDAGNSANPPIVAGPPGPKPSVADDLDDGIPF
jgi:hypothetical protein